MLATLSKVIDAQLASAQAQQDMIDAEHNARRVRNQADVVKSEQETIKARTAILKSTQDNIAALRAFQSLLRDRL